MARAHPRKEAAGEFSLVIALHIVYVLTGKMDREAHEMGAVATTKMSSKGQVVIPEEIRRRLGLKSGAQFVVVGERDTVILKAISPPSRDEFEGLLSQARRQARLAGLKQTDIRKAIADARGKQ